MVATIVLAVIVRALNAVQSPNAPARRAGASRGRGSPSYDSGSTSYYPGGTGSSSDSYCDSGSSGGWSRGGGDSGGGCD